MMGKWRERMDEWALIAGNDANIAERREYCIVRAIGEVLRFEGR